MRYFGSTTLLAGAAALAIALPATAQQGSGEAQWWQPILSDVVSSVEAIDRDARRDDRARSPRDDRARDDRARDDRGRDVRRDDRGRDARGQSGARQGQGPPFCRSGSGHPVHGWQWCVEKGWADRGLRDRAGLHRDDVRWERARWEDVIFRRDLPGGETRLEEPGLIEVLGSVILGRLDGERRGNGDAGRMEGRWLGAPDGGSVLQVRAGSTPLAELADTDGDGRVDVVFLTERGQLR